MPDSPGTTLQVAEIPPPADRRVRLHPPDPAFGGPSPDGGLGRLGPYRVLKRLGSGGMGAVYLAHDDGLDRRVALKVLLPEAAADPAGRDRFLLEARAAAAVKHDHVVTIYQVGEDRGVPFIAMEFLAGSSLDEYLIRNGRVSVPQALRVGWETAEGMAAAHALGLIHRDIKPANIWLEAPRGRVKILDFGIARRLADDPRTALTGTGMVVGTPGYMSPEQARGRHLDPRTDLFSLGVVLYRLTTGRLPFDGDTTMAVLTALAVDDPPPVRGLNPDVPPAFEEMIHRLLAKDPNDRPVMAEAVAGELRALAGGHTTVPVVYAPAADSATSAFEELGTGPTEALPDRPRAAGRGLWTAAAVVILLAAGIAASTAYSLRRPAPKEPPPEPAPAPAKAAKPPAPAPPPAADPRRGLVFAVGHSVEFPGFFLPADGPFTMEGYVTPGDSSPILGHVFGTRLQSRVVVARRDAAMWEGHVQNGEVPTLVERTAVVPGRRLHVALVRATAEIRLYLDGRLAEIRPARFALPAVDPFAVGGDGFTGTIDELRVSDTARYDKGFVPPPQLQADRDTLALYRFDEGEGNVLRDRSGNDRHGQIVRARWAGAPDRPTGAHLRVRPGGGLITQEELDGWLPRYLTSGNVTEDQAALIRDVRGITSVSQYPISEPGFERLCDLPWAGGLEQVNVSAPKLTDAGFAHVAKLKNLRVLVVRDSRVTDDGVKALSALPNLNALLLPGSKLTDAGAAHLAALPNLMVLDVSNTTIGNDGVKALAALPRLTELRLDGTAVTDAGLEHLRGRGVRVVSLKRTRATAAACKTLCDSLGVGSVVTCDPPAP